MGAILAPILFWSAQSLAAHGVFSFLARYDFETFFHRALLIAAVLFGSLLVRAMRATASGSSNRWVAVGCAGALSAILAYSMFDFNLYVPANAITLAWIAGVSAGLSSRQRRTEAAPIEVLSTAPSRSMRSH